MHCEAQAEGSNSPQTQWLTFAARLLGDATYLCGLVYFILVSEEGTILISILQMMKLSWQD